MVMKEVLSSAKKVLLVTSWTLLAACSGGGGGGPVGAVDPPAGGSQSIDGDWLLTGWMLEAPACAGTEGSLPSWEWSVTQTGNQLAVTTFARLDDDAGEELSQESYAGSIHQGTLVLDSLEDAPIAHFEGVVTESLSVTGKRLLRIQLTATTGAGLECPPGSIGRFEFYAIPAVPSSSTLDFSGGWDFQLAAAFEHVACGSSFPVEPGFSLQLSQEPDLENPGQELFSTASGAPIGLEGIAYQNFGVGLLSWGGGLQQSGMLGFVSDGELLIGVFAPLFTSCPDARFLVQATRGSAPLQLEVSAPSGLVITMAESDAPAVLMIGGAGGALREVASVLPGERVALSLAPGDHLVGLAREVDASTPRVGTLRPVSLARGELRILAATDL
jgi:hypothetical protein